MTQAITSTVSAMHSVAFSGWPAEYIAGKLQPTSRTPAVIVVLTTKIIGSRVTGA